MLVSMTYESGFLRVRELPGRACFLFEFVFGKKEGPDQKGSDRGHILVCVATCLRLRLCLRDKFALIIDSGAVWSILTWWWLLCPCFFCRPGVILEVDCLSD